MKSEFELQDLAEIPDPFANDRGALAAPLQPQPGAAPTRSRVLALRGAAFGAALVYDVLGVAVLKTRPDLGSLPIWALGLGLVIPLASAAIALRAVSRTGPYGLGQPVTKLAAIAVVAPISFALVTLLFSPLSLDDAAFWPHALGCMGTSLVLAVGPFVLGLWALRGAFAVSSAWRTGALGIACGALAAAALSLICPIGNGWHVLLGHGCMMIAMGLAGAALGRRITSA